MLYDTETKLRDKYGVVESFDKGLSEARRYTDPFLLYDFSPFSPEVYDLMVKYLPDASEYFDLQHPDAKRPDGTYARGRWPLQKHRIARLAGEQREFWTEMYEVLRSDELCKVFKNWLAPTLIERFKCPLDEIPCFPAPQLLRDTYGYKIAVHADTEGKAITTQWYLPATNDQAHLGTRVHRKLPSGQFEEVRQVEFRPNRGYAFGVKNDSFHSVMPMGPADGVRNSLIMFYYVEDITPP